MPLRSSNGRASRAPVAIALAAFALLGAAARTAPVAVRAAGGAPQSALAYAASTAPGYVTIFPRPLVVAIAGTSRDVEIRFRCVSPHCTFALSTQPESVKRVDARTYDVKSHRGRAEIALTLATSAPGTFAVVAFPAASDERRSASFARFSLDAR